jgi:hypothetical protein
MSAEYMHIGIPVTNRKPGMQYNEDLKIWMSNPEDYDYKIEYLKFEEGTPFPEIMHKNPHVAYMVDDIERYAADADRVIFPITPLGPGVRIAFVIKDDTIIELYEQK